ncbi:DNA-deoxyinosine glycosylase [Thiomicrospira sp.]|uniref:DNA-deoxyinosine glycosylase n=1 Tax=Thiomicrospira sp. TaxID=935 RepID=UPI002F93383A
MSICQSFNPIEPAYMRVLILGSMPGRASLDVQAYYAHLRNGFWPIMAELLQRDWPHNFAQRYQNLQQHHIGLWDVLAECERPGSLDSAIRSQTIQINDIPGLVLRHPECQAIALNGNKAADLFKRHVLKPHPAVFDSIQILALPSTSPAHASMSLQDKTTVWRDKIVNFL